MTSSAGGLAVLLGVMSTVVGTLTLVGVKQASYLTHDWLLVYNVALGLVSVAVGVALARRHARSLRLAGAVLASHVNVLFIVAALWFSEAAAIESVKAMVLRSSLWLVILLLTWGGLSARAGTQDVGSASGDGQLV